MSTILSLSDTQRRRDAAVESVDNEAVLVRVVCSGRGKGWGMRIVTAEAGCLC